MNVVIIGGTGLISTATVRELAARGDAVTLYNRGQSEPNGEMAPPGVRRMTGDRTDRERFERHMAEAGPFDVVIDMVGYAPEDAESLVRAFRGRTPHVVFCSTVDVYQKPAATYPIREDAPLGGLNDYARHKVAQEQTLMAAHRRGDFAVTILRPAFTYGEGRGLVHAFGFSNTFLDRLRRGRPVVVHGDGSSFWASCHRDDVGHAFAQAAGCPMAFGKSYNVTGEGWMTWDQYHRTVARALGGPEPRLVHIPTDLLVRIAPERAGICGDNFQFNNLFDTSAARGDLDFRQSIFLEDGVRRIAAWLDAHGGLPDSGADPYDDRIIAAWERASDALRRELTGGHA